MFAISALERQLTARKILRKAGDRRAYSPLLDRAVVDAAIRWLPLLPRKINTLFDIGAARGDVAADLDALFCLQDVILVEPRPEQAALLAGRTIGRRKLLFSCAVAERPGTAEFHVLNSEDSSSLLSPIVKSAEAAFPGFNFGGKKSIAVSVRTLDQIYAESAVDFIDLLKVDVQGAELGVFKGGPLALKRTKIIRCEVGLRTLYEGQPPFIDVYSFLSSLSFELISFGDTVMDSNGVPIQADATFVNCALRDR
jgi:FkbM family methyltransferase